MTCERMRSGAICKVAVLSGALFLLVAACEEQVPEQTEQGAAPTTEQPDTATTEGEPAEGEQQQ
jgi:hypothetical protein